MFIYNTTFSVSLEIEQEWLEWTSKDFVAAVTDTGLPAKHKMLRLLTELDNGAATYTLQLSFTSSETCNNYVSVYEDVMIKFMQDKFTGNFVYFSTLLQEL
jgi:hypothetical protein